ncbi:hypothetical protein RM717_14530 [Streptomyces griseus]|uniref:Nucleopolyhedrovirus P10 family protein n=2 Tax=Streptomyces stephensoniae TaxID=3375367 RepID=A0ABU2W347_9ACTN|nr:hypothetical protein [Streptomyces griseus]MDT0491724.1 hypothetical protein [Streptomyces griseus]
MTTERGPRRADGWTAAVRQRLGLGRLLPMGGPGEGTWIAETAAASVLRGAATGPGAVVGTLRIGPAREATGTWPQDAAGTGRAVGVDAGSAGGRTAGPAAGVAAESAGGRTAGSAGERATGPAVSPEPLESPEASVSAGASESREAPVSSQPLVSSQPPGASVAPVPPSALPPGPLRIEAEFRAAGDRPLPDAAAALRTVLVTAAAARLGLEVAEVDLRVTALLDADAPEQVTAPPVPAAPVPAAQADGPAGEAAAAVPGVVSLTRVLGSAVHTAEDHIRVEVATAGDHRALDVARSVRTAVSAATADRLPVSVLVTEVVERDGGGRSDSR